MTYQIWTRIVIASLILLGDSTFASEISQRNAAEAAVNVNTIQISQTESLGDSDSIWQPLFTDASSILNEATLSYQTLTTLVYLNKHSSQYELYNSRAPPAPF